MGLQLRPAKNQDNYSRDAKTAARLFTPMWNLQVPVTRQAAIAYQQPGLAYCE